MLTPAQKLKTTTEIKTEHTVTHRTPDWIDCLTLATPILTFTLGYYLNKLVEDYKETKRLNQIEKYYFSLLRTLLLTIDRQANAIGSTAVALEMLKGSDLLIQRLQALNTSRITAISDLDLYKAFILRKKNVELNNTQLTIIAGVVDVIGGALSKIQDLNQKFFSVNIQFHNTVNKLMEEILYMKNDFALEFKDSEAPHEIDFIIKSFAKHINNHQEKNGVKPFAEPIDIYNNLIKPLSEDMKQISTTPKAYPFMKLIDSAQVEFMRFFAFRDGHVQHIRSLATSLRGSATTIREAMSVLEAAR